MLVKASRSNASLLIPLILHKLISIKHQTNCYFVIGKVLTFNFENVIFKNSSPPAPFFLLSLPHLYLHFGICKQFCFHWDSWVGVITFKRIVVNIVLQQQRKSCWCLKHTTCTYIYKRQQQQKNCLKLLWIIPVFLMFVKLFLGRKYKIQTLSLACRISNQLQF